MQLVRPVLGGRRRHREGEILSGVPREQLLAATFGPFVNTGTPSGKSGCSSDGGAIRIVGSADSGKAGLGARVTLFLKRRCQDRRLT